LFQKLSQQYKNKVSLSLALYLVGKAAANLQLFSKPASFFLKKIPNIFLT
jgi:hypothetical protein